MAPKSRPRHPSKELEKLLKDAEASGWRVERGKQYYKAFCPCEEKHRETVHLTPSDPDYTRNKRKKMSKCKMWKANR